MEIKFEGNARKLKTIEIEINETNMPCECGTHLVEQEQ